MARRFRPDARAIHDLTDEPADEDGTDPQLFHDRRKWDDAPRRPGRKAMQLYAQVKDALTAILPHAADDVLRDAVVLTVEPAPHAGRLKVTVAVPVAADVAAARFHAAAGYLRAETAHAVHRRKAPELTFAVEG